MSHMGFCRYRTFLLIVGLILCSACEQTRNVIGLDKQPPDEFAVVTRAPLSVPPDFGLRPPIPGAQRPQEKTVRNEAREILLRSSKLQQQEVVRKAVQSGKLSTGEAALLSSAGALGIDPSIRTVVNRESSALVEAEESFLNKIFFWQLVDPPGSAVDPDKESRRLREAQASGVPLNKGDVPVIERKQRGILEGIF